MRGLTTAGSLWVVAALGMAAGAGYYVPAVAGAALTRVRALALRWSRTVVDRFREPERRVVVELKAGTSVTPLLGELGEISALEVDDERDRRVVTSTSSRASTRGSSRASPTSTT